MHILLTSSMAGKLPVELNQFFSFLVSFYLMRSMPLIRQKYNLFSSVEMH